MSHFVNGNDIHTIDGAYAHLCDQGFSGQNLSLIADLWEKASQLTEAQEEVEKLKEVNAGLDDLAKAFAEAGDKAEADKETVGRNLDAVMGKNEDLEQDVKEYRLMLGECTGEAKRQRIRANKAEQKNKRLLDELKEVAKARHDKAWPNPACHEGCPVCIARQLIKEME